MTKLLLHVCCGPCGIYPFYTLREEGYEITGFFYNPNIQPEEEFNRRKVALYEFAKKQNFRVIYFDYLSEDFFSKISPSLQKPERCFSCWELRLTNTAQYAKENQFDFFSTTLLISPYQDQMRLKEIGEKISQEQGIKFLYRDFREGFRDSHNKAKELGLYRQKYCGCIYSQVERQEIIKEKSQKVKV